MNELIVRQANLPDTMEELAQFVLVGREKYNSVRAEIRAIENLKLAEEVRNQKRQEAQMIAEAVLDAEVRLGELFHEIPKRSGGDRGNQYTSGKSQGAKTYGKNVNKTKTEVISDLGFSKNQSSQFKTLADNKDLVEAVKAEARENDEFPSRTRVLELAALHNKHEAETDEGDDNFAEPQILYIDDLRESEEAELDEYDSFIDLRMSVYKELSKIIECVDKFEITTHRMEALRDNFDDVLRVEDTARYINETIDKLNMIKMEIWKGRKNGKKL